MRLKSLFFLLVPMLLFAAPPPEQQIKIALRLQAKADSVQKVIDILTAQVDTLPQHIKDAVQKEIYANKQTHKTIQAEADIAFANIYKVENTPSISIEEYPFKPQPPEDTKDVTPLAVTLPDTIKLPLNVPNSIDFIISDKYEAPIIEKEFPKTLTYRVQISALSKPPAASYFRNMQPVFGFPLANGVTKYFIGDIKTYERAAEVLSKVKQNGFPEAFLVAYFNTKNIPITQAQKIEKQ